MIVLPFELAPEPQLILFALALVGFVGTFLLGILVVRNIVLEFLGSAARLATGLCLFIVSGGLLALLLLWLFFFINPPF
jgi:hypothetical protein